MILLLASWAVLLCAARIAGAAIFVAARCGQSLTRTDDRLIAQVWTGLFFLASALLAVSLVRPLRPAVGLSMLAVVGASLLIRAVRQEVLRAGLSSIQWGAFAAILLAASWNATGSVILYDTGLYHYPLIRWLHEAGTAPGMALLHYRLSFSSSWLAPLAVLDSAWLEGRGTTTLNGLALALITFQYAIVCSRLFCRTAKVADVFLAGAWAMVFYEVLAGRFQVSPSPNFPVMIGIVLAGWAALQTRDGEVRDWNLPLLLAAAAVSVRVLAIPMLAVIGIRRLIAGPRDLALAVVISTGIAAPVFLANFVSSGCPLFPSAVFCMHTASAVSPEVANHVSFESANWSRYLGPYPADAGFFGPTWFPAWIHDRFNFLFVGAMVVGLAVITMLRAWSWVFAAGLLGSGYVFLSVPDFRYAYGYSAVILGTVLVAIHERFAPSWWRPGAAGKVFVWMTALAVLIVLGDSRLRDAPEVRWNLARILAPQPLPTAPLQWIKVQNGHLEYMNPAPDERCFGLSLVCTPHMLSPDVDFCRPAIGAAGGFCRTK